MKLLKKKEKSEKEMEGRRRYFAWGLSLHKIRKSDDYVAPPPPPPPQEESKYEFNK